MTDLEMTKLCAEAMGIALCNPTALQQVFGTAGLMLVDNIEKHYAPLHDDAQAMALQKRFGLYTHKEGCIWTVGRPLTENADLNRAIVECVAKMQNS